MENFNYDSNFWNLLGGVSGTLSAFSFILITFSYEKIEKIKKKIYKDNLKVYNILLEQIFILLIFFLMPFFLSLLMIEVNEKITNIQLVLFLSYCVYIVSLLYGLFFLRNVKNIRLIAKYIIISLSFIIFLIMDFYFERKFVLKLLPVLFLLTGFIELFYILYFYDSYKSIIEITENYMSIRNAINRNLIDVKNVIKKLYGEYEIVTSKYRISKEKLDKVEEDKIKSAAQDCKYINNRIDKLNIYLKALEPGIQISYVEYKEYNQNILSIKKDSDKFISNLTDSINKAAELGHTPN